ncbi:class IIb bacteriocin, lactobin A/cerein 7B family [Streptococcus iniae]
MASVDGGKINWGSVAGNCVGGAIITGAFSVLLIYTRRRNWMCCWIRTVYY